VTTQEPFSNSTQIFLSQGFKVLLVPIILLELSEKVFFQSTRFLFHPNAFFRPVLDCISFLSISPSIRKESGVFFGASLVGMELMMVTLSRTKIIFSMWSRKS